MAPSTPLDDLPIAPAVLDDAGELLTLQRLAYQSEAAITGDFDIPPLTQTLEELRADLARMTVLKATRQGRLVGSVRAWADATTAHIGRLIVHPELQNRGLGKRLMAAIEAAFPTVPRFELFTGERSERNQHLYQKLGYVRFRSERISPTLTLTYLEKHRAAP